MTARQIKSVLCSLLFIAAGTGNAASTAQTVGIKLEDSSTDPSIAHMRVVLDHDALKPGRVTFQADNRSKTLVHEVLIARDNGAKELPYDAKHDRVIEARVHPLGEIADLAPGKTGKLSLNLKPGKYLVFCNQPGHYKDGMIARLTVAP